MAWASGSKRPEVRRRLVAAFVGLTVLVVAAYGIPRAFFLADLVRSQEQERVERTADVLVQLVDTRAASDQDVSAEDLAGWAADGEHLALTGRPAAPDAEGGAPAEGEGSVTAVRELSGGGALSVTRVASAVDDAITHAVLPLVVLGLLLATLSGLGGLLLARRLARPFRELAVAAERLGEGHLHPDLPAYDVPEAHAIGRALEEAGVRLADLLEHEHQVAVHASHRLRTPVTALRLELEDLTTWPATAEEIRTDLARCVAELDRLEQAIAELLDGAEERRAARAVDVDLEDLVAEAVARHGGPSVAHTRSGPVPVHVDPRPVAQVLGLLVDDALAAGAERIEVTVVPHAGHHEVQLVSHASRPLGDPPEPDPSWTHAQDLAVAAAVRIARHGATRVLLVPRGAVPPPTSAPQ